MKPRYRLSRDAVELIERFEGFRRKAARLDNGGWTVGFGHTKTAREGAVVSREDAEALLLYDLIGVSHVVNEKIFTPLTQNQFDALVAFTFSIGVENFETSAVLRRVNEGQMLAAAYAMEMWRRAPVGGEMIVVDALVRRRAAEKALFLTPPEGVAPAPSPVLPPNLDYDLLTAAPRETPVVVETPLDGDQASAERVDEDSPLPPPPTASEDAAAALQTRLEGLLAESPEETPADVEAEAEEPTPEPPAPPALEILTPQTLSGSTFGGFDPENPIPFEDVPSDFDEDEAHFEEIAPTEDPEVEAFSAADAEPAPAVLELPASLPEVSAPEESAPVEMPAVETEVEPVQEEAEPVEIEAEAPPEHDPFLLTPPVVETESEVEPTYEAAENDRVEAPGQSQLFEAQPVAAWTGAVAASDRLTADLRTFRHEDAIDFHLTREDGMSAGLLVAGLVLFGGGLVWAMVRTPTSGALVNSVTVGWGVGFIGVVLACIGFYRLLQRLLEGRDEDSDRI